MVINRIVINNYKNIINQLYKLNPNNINNKLQMSELKYRNSIYSYVGTDCSKESSLIIQDLLSVNKYNSNIYNIRINNKKIYYLHVPDYDIIISPTWREILVDTNNKDIYDMYHIYLFNTLPPFYIGTVDIFEYYSGLFINKPTIHVYTPLVSL